MISDEQLVRRCQRRPQLLEQPLIRGIVTEPPLATADQRFGGASVRAFTRRRLTGIGAVPPGSLQKEMPFRINRPKKMAVSDRPNTCAVPCSLVLGRVLIKSVGEIQAQMCRCMSAFGGKADIGRL
jgi:hypothetical protein